MVTRLLVLTLFQITLTCSLSGQTKFEREYPIKSGDVPAAAQRQVSAWFPNARTRWYREESMGGVTVEAKLKSGKERFSIEFDTSGRVQDIEVVISRSAIPAAVRQRMETELSRSFVRHKMQKVQVQYTGAEVTARSGTRSFDRDRVPIHGYEVILKGHAASGPALYEISFSPDGAIVHTAEIIIKNTDNLEY